MSDTADTARRDDDLERVAHWADQMRAAITARNEAIVTAVRAGAGQREVARAAGLSHPGVAKIVARTDVDA